MRALSLITKTIRPASSRITAFQLRLPVRPVHQNLKHLAGIHVPPSNSTVAYSDELDDEIDDKPAPSILDQRFPEIHTVQVKRKGRKAGWDDIRVELTSHRDRQHHRARRVWTTLVDNEDTAGLSWNSTDGKIFRSTLLKDSEENKYSFETGLEDEAKDFAVTEKIIEMCGEERRMWREVIKKSESNDEELDISWEEMMEEEGFNAELERERAKYP